MCTSPDSSHRQSAWGDTGSEGGGLTVSLSPRIPVLRDALNHGGPHHQLSQTYLRRVRVQISAMSDLALCPMTPLASSVSRPLRRKPSNHDARRNLIRAPSELRSACSDHCRQEKLVVQDRYGTKNALDDAVSPLHLILRELRGSRERR